MLDNGGPSQELNDSVSSKLHKSVTLVNTSFGSPAKKQDELIPTQKSKRVLKQLNTIEEISSPPLNNKLELIEEESKQQDKGEIQRKQSQISMNIGSGLQSTTNI